MAQLNDVQLQKVYVWMYITLPLHMFDSFVITSWIPCAVIVDPSLRNPGLDHKMLLRDLINRYKNINKNKHHCLSLLP